MKVIININDKLVKFGKMVFTKRNAVIGIVLLCFIGGFFAFSQVITKPHEYHTGDIISAEEMNENFDELYAAVNALAQEWGIAPVGSIIAWHKSMAFTPTLPDGWVECNGQTIADPESVYDGEVVPDLNGEGRFLRGGSGSGIMQDATSIATRIYRCHWIYLKNSDGQDGTADNISYTSSGDGAYTITYEKVRPINMSVVWIMRIK